MKGIENKKVPPKYILNKQRFYIVNIILKN